MVQNLNSIHFVNSRTVCTKWIKFVTNELDSGQGSTLVTGQFRKINTYIIIEFAFTSFKLQQNEVSLDKLNENEEQKYLSL